MKHLKKTNVYKGSNVEFYPDKMTAYSYGYWLFLKRINGKIVFNKFPFSITTQAHQRKVRKVLQDLGISIDLEIESPLSLDRPEYLERLKESYKFDISELKAMIANPRTKKEKNQERQLEIERLEIELSNFLGLINEK